jgi:beta-glucosidase/6-phospho-beta-glucosidase/beta-galactosidase
MANPNLIIPDDFIIGVGDSDLQVVGEDIVRQHEGSVQSMTDFYGRTEPDMTPPGIAIDRYSRYKEDVALMSQLGFKQNPTCQWYTKRKSTGMVCGIL